MLRLCKPSSVPDHMEAALSVYITPLRLTVTLILSKWFIPKY